MEVAEPEQGQLGRYRIERTLGAGGMGVVYLAEDTRLRRQVAIKKLRKDSTSESAGARIHSEAQLLAQLNHANIVQLYDVLEEDGGIALVMEYVEGTTLREWMREHTAPLREKLGLLMQICRGLGEAHSLGIIHRDLKPDNILITLDNSGGGIAKITDFGIAKSLEQDGENITREDQVAGTVDAMSPEQLQGLPLCARSDLFSLGTIAYELLCGAKPFDRGEGGTMALAQKVVNEPHIPPQRARQSLPDPLAALLDKLLAKHPEQRPESAQQVYEALELLHQHGSDDTDTEQFSATVTQLLRKPPSRHRRTFRALAGAAALAATGVAGYFGWQYATRLEPQYIAVMPVEISGEVRGEKNAEALTATMVRQALMNAASQLKASALVSFTPKEGQDFDTQLKALREKGVTDALYARLDCARVRCEIELQRVGPVDSQIKQQTDFAFLADKRQEAEYRISNSAATLFPSSYHDSAVEQRKMGKQDYDRYLAILSKTNSNAVAQDDLESLENLIATYSKNASLYLLYADAATDLYLSNNDRKLLSNTLGLLARAEESGINEVSLLEAKLLVKSLGTDKEGFESTLSALQAKGHPSAHLLAQYARFQFTQGDYESGLRYAQDAAALNPSADNLYLIALNQTASGNYDDARNTLNRIVQFYPKHWSSYSALGVIELESGNLVEAEAAITAIPENLRGWRTKSNLGVVYFLQKKYEPALEAYQQVLADTPNDVYTITQIGETQQLLGNVSAAEKSFQKVITLTAEKEDIETRLSRALALAKLGKLESSIPIILQLIKNSPDNSHIKYGSAQVYSLAEEWRSADYYVHELLKQGMSAEWFNLPAFQRLCTQPQASTEVKTAICD
ncbi:serine/threonine-protein kinase [Microbulbifer halophilus]|uniref:Protein kinase n=1 Tax=Microbulbifer halophilus TaxID=453963 RepID=A0ABW5EC04_9GAMM|nr:serine/threonine-protein kinase [Microbulbifer halophilus]MCW8125700.1 protein kinase [Microbulbifer halophilus]